MVRRLLEDIINMIEEKARELDDADMFLYKVKFHQTVPQFRVGLSPSLRSLTSLSPFSAIFLTWKQQPGFL